MDNLLEIIRQEMPVIKQAPWSIGITVLLLTAASFGLIYWGFNENLTRKNDLIKTLTGQLELAKKGTAPATETAKPSQPATGPATAIGNGNAVNSGNESTVKGQSKEASSKGK
jgi:hypothetical protein